MKMTDVDARLAELESHRIDPGLSVAEQNELRDCEITLGMVAASPRARAEAARRVERFAAERAAKKTPAQLQREIDEVLARKHGHRSHAEKKSLSGNKRTAYYLDANNVIRSTAQPAAPGFTHRLVGNDVVYVIASDGEVAFEHQAWFDRAALESAIAQ